MPKYEGTVAKVAEKASGKLSAPKISHFVSPNIRQSEIYAGTKEQTQKLSRKSYLLQSQLSRSWI